MIAQETISAIFVAWQQPQTRRYYPVARLAQVFFEDAPLYEFAYVQGAMKPPAPVSSRSWPSPI